MDRVKTKLRGTLTKEEAEILRRAKDIFEEFNQQDDIKDTFHDQVINAIECDSLGWYYMVCFIEELFNNCDIIEEEQKNENH